MKLPMMILMMASMLLSITACSSNDLNDITSSKETVDVMLTISSRASANDPESQIKSLRVLAFKGEKLAAQYIADPTLLNKTTHNFTMRLHVGDTRFYVIANEDAAGTLKTNNKDNFSFSESITASELEKTTFSTLPSNVAVQGIPMTAIYQVNVQENTPIIIDNLKRTIAKLNIYAAKKGEGQVYMNRGIYLYNMPKYGYLFPESQNTTLGPNDYEYNELESGGKTEDGINQKNGKIILSSKWGNETSPTVPKAFEITKIFSLNMEQIPENYQMIPNKTIYLFANPNSADINKSYAYYLKFGWTEIFKNVSDALVTEKPLPSSIYLPIINANDKLQFFAHVSISGHINIEFNWHITGWTPAGGDIEFN